jgi:type I restriction enzyme S subunit
MSGIGIEWLPNIPESWSIVKVGISYNLQLGKMLQNEAESGIDKQYPYLKAINVNWGKVDSDNLPKMWANSFDISKYQVLNGDLLVCEGGEVGRAAIANNIGETTIIQNALHRVRSRYSSVKYLAYFLEHTANCGWFEILCNKATIAHFTSEKFSSLLMPLPSLPIQKAIAAYLDKETVRIDALIAKKGRQIELLQEKRQAIITRAITKGLDPKAKMKDSGVEWIGEIPEGWGVKRLRYVCEVNPISGKKDFLSSNTGVSFVPMESIGEQGTLYLTQIKPIEQVSAGYTYFEDGDVIFAKITPCFENWKGALVSQLVNGIAFGTTELHVLRPRYMTNGKYLYYLVTSYLFRKTGESYMYGAGGQKRVPETFVKDFSSPFPPISIQKAIADYLDEEINRFNTLKEKIEKSITLLREYRFSLITAAVSGQIDVSQEIPG